MLPLSSCFIQRPFCLFKVSSLSCSFGLATLFVLLCLASSRRYCSFSLLALTFCLLLVPNSLRCRLPNDSSASSSRRFRNASGYSAAFAPRVVFLGEYPSFPKFAGFSATDRSAVPSIPAVANLIRMLPAVPLSPVSHLGEHDELRPSSRTASAAFQPFAKPHVLHDPTTV